MGRVPELNLEFNPKAKMLDLRLPLPALFTSVLKSNCTHLPPQSGSTRVVTRNARREPNPTDHVDHPRCTVVTKC